MRIFIGIKVKKSLCKEISEWRNITKKVLPARYINGKNLHATLVPPWNAKDVKKTVDALKDGKVKIKPFWINFDSVRFGPKEKHPNLIWAEGESPAELIKMKEEIENLLEIKPQRKSFKLHLTLARFKKSDFVKFKSKKLRQQAQWSQKVTSFEIFESTLSKTGADYKIIASLKLQG